MKKQISNRGPEQLQFDWRGPASVGPDQEGAAAGQAIRTEVKQMSAAPESKRDLEQDLMERVADEANLVEALQRVCANKGSAGIDHMSVAELKAWMGKRAHREKLKEQLCEGSYQPSPVRGVQIPKPGGKGMRQLGIPTVVDRLVQQALLQVLEPKFDPKFSESSYGFRPERGAHDALRQASEYVGGGRKYVVDLDLEKFFDRVQHDVLMVRVSRVVKDKRVLALIGRFLRAGMMQNGVCVRRQEGTPQGGPLSPLLANILLDDLDKELERRGHKFCRYADDCNIYVKSQAAGQRVLESVTQFLEKKLKLKVNGEKSAADKVQERKFLGHRLLADGRMVAAPESEQRLKESLRELTGRNAGRSFESVIQSVNQKLTGWIQYYRHAHMRTMMRGIGEWLRRKLRCLKLKQCRKTAAIARFLTALGVNANRAWTVAGSGKGWWRLADTQQAHVGMSLSWFKDIGLIDPEAFYLTLRNACPLEPPGAEQARRVV